MQNQHNPIAVRVENVQKHWEKARADHAKARLFSLVSYSNDYPLVEGFLRLACSEHSKLADTFVGFFVDFETTESFYHTLITEWLTAFKVDAEKNPSWHWKDFDALQQEFTGLTTPNAETLRAFYVKLVTSFKEFEARTKTLLVISLIIKKINDVKELHKAIQELHELLPNDIALLLIDYKEREVYHKMLEPLQEKAVVIEVPNQNMQNAYKEIATQGNPNDPQVRYRKCLFEMGEAAKAKKGKRLKKLGNELIDISKGVGETSFWASSYLIYAGFLFQFKETALIHELLDKGIKIVTPHYEEKQECAGVLLQLLMYKASYYSIQGESTKAIAGFVEVATLAKSLKEYMQAINGYNYALMLALKKGRAKYEDILIDAFTLGYSFSDEELKVINITFIVYNYMKKISLTDDEAETIAQRMVALYGEDWKNSSKKMAKEIASSYELTNK